VNGLCGFDCALGSHLKVIKVEIFSTSVVSAVIRDANLFERRPMRYQVLIVAISCWFLITPELVRCQDFAGSAIAISSQADGYQTKTGVLYRRGDDLTDYMKKNCLLDVYYPSQVKDFPTVVWFHGGGLTSGKRAIPEELLSQGVAVVAVDYRLYPKAKSPEYIRDAAAAVAWTFENIGNFGGNDNKIFVSGHSAGGYLTYMVGMDQRWLAEFQIDANRIAGLIPYSGHTITHFTVRAERGINKKVPVVDDMAPLYHVRKEAPPLLIITGDRELELLGRYEESAYFWRMMKVVGHQQVEILELDGYNHGQMAKPAHPLLLKFVKQISNQIK
jgi:acetyl esterase/lipase